MLKKFLIRFVIYILIVGICVFLLNLLWTNGASGEEEIEHNKVIVIVDSLNGRFRPSKSSPVLAEYTFLDELTPTGKWSKDHQWIEIYHPEEGELWVNINYISERLDIFEVYTLNDQPIKVRSKPEVGKVKKYLKKDQHVEITQVVMGYGRCEYGWLDLGYFIEEPKDYEGGYLNAGAN